MATWHLAKITLDRILAAGEAEGGAEAGQFGARGLDGLWERHVIAEHKPVADTAAAPSRYTLQNSFTMGLFIFFIFSSFLYMISDF